MIDGVLISEHDSRLCFRICTLDLPFVSSLEIDRSSKNFLNLVRISLYERC